MSTKRTEKTIKSHIPTDNMHCIFGTAVTRKLQVHVELQIYVDQEVLMEGLIIAEPAGTTAFEKGGEIVNRIPICRDQVIGEEIVVVGTRASWRVLFVLLATAAIDAFKKPLCCAIDDREDVLAVQIRKLDYKDRRNRHVGSSLDKDGNLGVFLGVRIFLNLLLVVPAFLHGSVRDFLVIGSDQKHIFL